MADYLPPPDRDPVHQPREAGHSAVESGTPVGRIGAPARLRSLARRWANASPAERSNAQLYITELCDALEVEHPRPAGSGYEFEYTVKVYSRDGSEHVNRADLYKRGCLLLEAKDTDPKSSPDVLLRKAFGQARTYVSNLPHEPPPYLLVLDIASKLLVWDRWSGNFGGFNAARVIDLRTLADSPRDIDLLRDIWENPASRNPRKKAARVTREIAGNLAELAASLEKRGFEQDRVAKFLIRCVFTMFAEDVHLIEEEPFRRIIERTGYRDPTQFPSAVAQLWAAMDRGGWFGADRMLQFNGHFFSDAECLPLQRSDLVVLHQAASADWKHVEPAIFGTLLTRAFDRAERHRLGAEFTPREYVERVVRPTIEEPVREWWTAVQVEVIQLRAEGQKGFQAAVDRLRAFHDRLRQIVVLDPACGSGNFLYVALHSIKRIEFEVFQAIEELTGTPELLLDEVHPRQFCGIEIKPWAREITELTLWIGYHQFWMEHYGGRPPREPLLAETHTLECRDAILTWEGEPVEDPSRSSPDPEPRIRHPVTGRLVPDPEAKRPYLAHRNSRQAPWPKADFIVGNPPYLGKSLMRHEFGDGYVEALRSAYSQVPDGADYVMYWWYRAAREVATGRTIRAGLITTNSIRQPINRQVVAAAQETGVRLTWVIPDHPWVADRGAADVTVAMTVISRDAPEAARVEVDELAQVIREIRVEHLNSDLSAHADVAGAAKRSLLSNEGLAANGFLVYGRGFILDEREAQVLMRTDRHHEIIRPVRNGRDLAARPRGLCVIDFGLCNEDEARRYPVLYDVVRSRVKPYRDTVKDRSRRERWWQFGRTNEALRSALKGRRRYIATPYVSKHRFFTFLDGEIAAEDSVVCIALDDPYFLGLLSSRIHVEWALAAGGRLGVGNDPRYNKSLCFDPFPFPEAAPELREKIGATAERILAHRNEATRSSNKVTVTGIYNVVEKLRWNDPLSAAERKVFELAACGVLLDLHEELDRLVAEAFGWDWPLEPEEILSALVSLHKDRVREEESGIVRWLRPEYQIGRFGGVELASPAELDLGHGVAPDGVEGVLPWPDTALDQIAALKRLSTKRAWSIDEVASRFRGANRDLVTRHLETLAIIGEVHRTSDARYTAPRGSSVAALA